MKLAEMMGEMQMDSDDAIMQAMSSNNFGDLTAPSDRRFGSNALPFSNSCGFSSGSANKTNAKYLPAIDEDFENLLKCEPSLLDPRLLQLRSSTSAPSRYGKNELTVPKTNCLGSSTPSLHVVGENRSDQESLCHQSVELNAIRNKQNGSNATNETITNFCALEPPNVPCMQAFPIGPPPSLKQTTMTSRTQMRQHLQKQQIQEEERRRKSTMNQQLSTPSSLPSEPLNIQSHSIPPAKEVPIQVLQVRSKLENPTPYHVVKCQQRQVKEYLTGKQVDPVATRSLPACGAVASRTATTSNTNALTGGTLVTSVIVGNNNALHFSAPNSPQSVAMESSTANSMASDVDEILEFINLDTMTADDNGHPNTVPNIALFGDMLNLQPVNGKTSSSCPDLPPIKEECQMTTAQFKALVKDRQKKDTHNMIERRRRFNINDRIKELGDLLPKNNERYYELVRDVKQNKGTILKASVDYIKQLKRDLERMQKSEERRRQLEVQNKELYLWIKQLEETAIQHGLPIAKTTWRAASVKDIMDVFIKQEPETLPIYKQECDASPILDLMEEDYSAINGDPMLSSPPDGSTGSNNLDDTLSHDSMDLMP